MPPLAETRLKQIATDACDQALQGAESYLHSSANTWNTQIIKKILESLISETSVKDAPPPFKFAVNSTIIQHQAVANGDESSSGGRRGMHSAQGAYWNNEKDGQWSMKYEGGDKKGMDVVVSIIWIAV